MARKFTTPQPLGIHCPKCGEELRNPNRTAEADERLTRVYCRACRKVFAIGTIKGQSKSEAAKKSAAKAGLRSSNSTGYKGVCLDKKTGRFVAKIIQNGKTIWLGRHSTAENAAIAYNTKALELFGPDAYQNDITAPRNPSEYDYGARGHNPYS